MLTRAEVRKSVNGAELAYDECWALLALMKSGRLPDDLVTSMLGFQPKLATAISELSAMYRKLASEKEKRIKAKEKLSPGWFKRRMRFLDSQQSAVEHAILIGKSMGDGFAWFFYQKNRAYLAEHLKLAEQLLMPSGAGGFAELEVVKNLPVINGHLVLYHGITSILRLGDFSLISLKDLKVVTVGEIKAGKPANEKLEISLLFHLDRHQSDFKPIQHPTPRPEHQTSGAVAGFSPQARDRLKRQISRMASSHSSIKWKPDKNLSLEMENQVDDFAKFINSIHAGRCNFLRIGRGLLLVGLKMPDRALYDRLQSGAELGIKRRLVGMDEQTASLVSPDRKDNSLFVGSWFFRKDGKLSHKPGMTHPIWWPIAEKSIRRVIFQEVVVLTVFNPAHFFGDLENAGFQVAIDWPHTFSAEKRIDNRLFSLQGIGHYLELLQHYFFSEKDILEFLKQIEDQLPLISSTGPGKIELHIEQHFGDSRSVPADS